MLKMNMKQYRRIAILGSSPGLYQFNIFQNNEN